MIRTVAFIFASIVGLSPARADHRDTSPGVTMERCSNVDIDELQEAIAVEYQGQDDHRTMVTVVCRDAIATVRVLGPSHPRGRIVDVDIAGVDPVVLPRMIALMAVEMWTAPDVETLSVAETSVVRDAPAPAPKPTKGEPPRPRQRFMVGAGLTSLHRSVHAGRPSGSVGATGSFAAMSLHADWHALSWIGFFANFSLSSHVHLNGLESLGTPVRWANGEYGFYVPIVKRRYRINARYTAGWDDYQPRDNIFVDGRMALLPNYLYDSLGFDVSYLVDEKFRVEGSTSLLLVNNRDDEFSNPDGYRWGVGLSYDVAEHVRLNGDIAAASLNENHGSRAYSDVMTSLEFGVQFFH